MESNDTKQVRKALGRGLDALLPSPSPISPALNASERTYFLCPVEKIAPQKGQPRQYFDEQALSELANSIREHGILEPLVVRRSSSTRDPYELIAGERRWRAAQKAGLKEVPVVVKDISTKTAFELALVENLQREDLNPIEIAESMDRLLREHNYTQQSLADRLSKDRTTVVNALRLLKLPPQIRAMVISRELSEGHARALLGAADDKLIGEIADKVIRGRLSVRQVEQLVRQSKTKKNGSSKNGTRPSASVIDLQNRLMRRLGTKVEVRDHNGYGELVIHYASLDELDRILTMIDRP